MQGLMFANILVLSHKVSLTFHEHTNTDIVYRHSILCNIYVHITKIIHQLNKIIIALIIILMTK